MDVKDFGQVPKSEQQTKQNLSLYLPVARERLAVELLVCKLNGGIKYPGHLTFNAVTLEVLETSEVRNEVTNQT